MVGSVVSIGIPGALITVLLSVSNIVLNNFIGIYGSDYVVGWSFTGCCPAYRILLWRREKGENVTGNKNINNLTSYFQALGKAVKSLLITVMRNIILFIPAVIILNGLWHLNGVIAAQPVVETVLAIICIAMYAKDSSVKTHTT